MEEKLILVAEDSATNREVIGRMLRKLGYRAEIVEDGGQAVAAWRTGRHALLLTDCHMPVMDGFALTAAIRAEEAARPGSPRLPIIAVTASAQSGEARGCLAAGMDACMPKPVGMQELQRVLGRFLPGATVEAGVVAGSGDHDAKAAARTGTAPAAGPVDLAVLQGLFGDDDAACREILRDFVAPAHAIVREIHAAAGAGSGRDLQQAAHKLKSAARSIGAGHLADLCQWLEAAAAESRLGAAVTKLEELDEACAAVTTFIAEQATDPDTP